MRQVRLKTITLTITLCYVLVIARLFYWQIIKNPELYQKVINQNYKTEILYPLRGTIYDADNRPLVLNQTYYQLSLYKPDIKGNLTDQIFQIKQIEPQLGIDDINQLNKFTENQNLKWITLKYLFSESQKQQLNKSGLSFSYLNTRYYPEDKLAKNILGFTTIDSVGNLVTNGGLESYYQKQLKGKMGFIWETKDATGKTVLSKSGWRIDAVNGRNLHTSIHRQIQYLTEDILEKGVNQFTADSGSITIIKPDTGSILAMASFTASSSATPSAVRNPIISNLFEPGSIFKPLVMSMALDTNTIGLDFICTNCNKPHQIGQYSISNWDNSLHPDTTLKDIIKNSDNIGMSYVIEKLGLDNFLRYFNLLNLNRKTGIDLQGEVKPVPKVIWPDIDFATAAFGQGFAITQIQMLTAFNTIANNGIMTPPHLVKYLDNGGIIYPNKLSPNILIFKPDTIKQMKQILKYAVENGVVARFKPADLEVCAKSGTAQIAVKGGYSDSSTIASYVGFSPCENPKFTMIVTINNPKSSPWGSSTAAPIWYELASKLSSLL